MTTVDAIAVVVIQGSDDFTMPTSLAKALVDGVEAPRKAFVTINGEQGTGTMASLLPTGFAV